MALMTHFVSSSWECLPLRFIFYRNNLMVTHNQSTFFLSFFSMRDKVSRPCNIPGKVMVCIIIVVLPSDRSSENNSEPSDGENSPDLFCS